MCLSGKCLKKLNMYSHMSEGHKEVKLSLLM